MTKTITSSCADAVLLAIGGHDPCGGAGIQADIEAAAALGVHCATAITCITVQTSCRLTQINAQPPAQLRDQCEAVLSDCPVAAIKIGLIGHSHLVQTIVAILDAHPQLPVVFDPVLGSGSGEHIADAALLNQLRRHLLRRCLLITPNLPEARLLADSKDREHAARHLLGMGADAVLITGTHDSSSEVTNRLYRADQASREWSWPRLPDAYHGSGCTLASAVAARLALGMELETAVGEAQRYVARTLEQARSLARCQLIPRRLLQPEHPSPGGQPEKNRPESPHPNALRTLVATAPTRPDNEPPPN